VARNSRIGMVGTAGKDRPGADQTGNEGSERQVGKGPVRSCPDSRCGHRHGRSGVAWKSWLGRFGVEMQARQAVQCGAGNVAVCPGIVGLG